MPAMGVNPFRSPSSKPLQAFGGLPFLMTSMFYLTRDTGPELPSRAAPENGDESPLL